MVKIDKDIPLPTPARTGVRKYPFRQMNVGDSFLSPDAKFESLRCYASNMGAHLRKKFMVRKVDDGVRVWRTE